MSDNRVYIFDTTLRDGQQSPGAGMTFEDNLRYAEYAQKLGVDILEAGFPAAGQTDFEVVKTIAQQVADTASPMLVAALCQLREAQCLTTMEALRPCLASGRARVHVYVPVDPNLMPASLGKLAEDKPKIIEELHRLVSLAYQAGFSVELSPEGYSRMQGNFDFVTDLLRAAISAGASVINCPDTIGGASRIEGDAYFVNKMRQHATIIKQEFPQSQVIWSTHCHNDFGLALDNSINAVLHGPARQIEGCINGVGERAGNVALEQCIMYIKEFGARACPENPYHTHVNYQYLQQISDFIASKMLPRQPHAPIVGENAARHSSGGHTNAILKNPLAYQPFDPREMGGQISFVFGPLSGSNHAREVIVAHGYVCGEEEKVAIAQGIKDHFATRRKGITDAELIAGYRYFRSPIKVAEISYARQDAKHVLLIIRGKFFAQDNLEISYQGKNSALAGLSQAIDMHFPGIVVLDYHSSSGSPPTVEAECHSTISIVTPDKRSYQGTACDADIEISALMALIDAVNQAYIDKYYRIKE